MQIRDINQTSRITLAPKDTRGLNSILWKETVLMKRNRKRGGGREGKKEKERKGKRRFCLGVFSQSLSPTLFVP